MEIEKLKDMLRNAAGGPVGIQMCHEAADALEQLQAENEKLKAQVPMWIPVEERLPGDADGLVVMTDGECVHPSYGNAMFGLEEKLGVFAPTKKKPWGYMQVTHWMPLPKAPKEKKKDD